MYNQSIVYSLIDCIALIHVSCEHYQFRTFSYIQFLIMVRDKNEIKLDSNKEEVLRKKIKTKLNKTE